MSELDSARSAMPGVVHPSAAALALYILFGAIMGVVAVTVTRSVYFIEDHFERLPIHWMWWRTATA